MFLKKLELNGFKSFADKTVFKFEPGVTAIVGPNGCGKSNVADALRWILGEQGTKSIRVHKSEDLIFNGSMTRKGEGYAQVSMTVEKLANENSSNQEVISDNPEVSSIQSSGKWQEEGELTVTRRFYRSGESEYLINKEQVRLKDIIDLFSDTGLGGNAYSVIERDRIDLILNGKPEDRRFLFEEASGIMKYRHRKIETMRKLEDTEANILRINDIVAEVKRSINAIRRQVSKAERYKRHFAELKDLEININLSELKKINQAWDGLKDDLDKARKSDEEFRKSLITIEEKIDKLRIQLAEKEDALRSQRDKHYEIISLREKTASQISLNEERKNNLSIRKEEIKKETLRIEERLNSINLVITNSEKEISEITSTIEKYDTLIKEKESELGKEKFHLLEARKKEKDFLCLCCTVCTYRSDREGEGCFLKGKRFQDILNQSKEGAQEAHNNALTIQQEIEQIEKRIQILTRELDEKKLASGSIQGRLEAKKEYILSANSEKQELAQMKKNLEREIEEFPLRLKNAEEEIQKLKTELESFAGKADENKNEITKFEEEYVKARQLVAEEETKIRDMRRARENEDKRFRELEIKEIEFKLQTENIIQKLRQDYNYDPQVIQSSGINLPQDFDPEQAEIRAADLREKIERIGQVNLVATEEYQRLKERYLFLKNQMDDLTKAQENLKKLIEEVEKICKMRFAETFTKVKENFENMYKRFFDGGEAQLYLSNPEDLLGSGIEITAQPPGKKLQNIFLLSAGEQTLTAISLLFAIFLVKPSPFCLLDEIDAPLDETNIMRFAKILQEFSRLSQFIVITHNKRTMEAANILYGITMEESGVSKLVSVKMGEPVAV